MVQCPLCDYEGTGREVNAHISGKSDRTHKGFVGEDFEGYFEDLQTNVELDPSSANGEEGNQTQPSKTDGKNRSQPSKTEGKNRSKENGLPEVRCSSCGREVQYPEMMPYKATCPGCGEEMRERDAFEQLEKKADERGKDELAETAKV